MNAASLSHSHESVSYSIMNLMEASDTSYGTRITDKVVRIVEASFNESIMHKVAERPIELWRVAFMDATPLTDDKTMHTQATLCLADSMVHSTANETSK